MPSLNEKHAELIEERERTPFQAARDAEYAIRYGHGATALENAREGDRRVGYTIADTRRELRAVQFAEKLDSEAEEALMVRLYEAETAQAYHRAMIEALAPVVAQIEAALRGRVDPEIRDLAGE